MYDSLQPDQISHDPLSQAAQVVARTRTMQRWLIGAPLLLTASVLAGFTMYDPRWYRDVFLLIIVGIFVFGQAAAFVQYHSFGQRLRRAAATIRVLCGAGPRPDLRRLSIELGRAVQSCCERDLVLHWLELGLKGEHESSAYLFDNAREREAISSSNTIRIHTMLNRTTLKMGFLGTLIGLVRTFPPMKRAILGLSDSGGEMRFVRDIACAIDGDQYAILTTLVATALSVLVETLSIQVLERFFGGFEKIYGHLSDWYVCVVLPIVRREYSESSHQTKLFTQQAENARRRMEAQLMLEKHVKEMAGIMKLSFDQIQELGRMQKDVNQRMSKLLEYECEYMNYITAKDEMAVPAALPRGM